VGVAESSLMHEPTSDLKNNWLRMANGGRKSYPKVVTKMFCFFLCLAVLGFELRALHLQSRRSMA
jgi:hypothetical protein